MSKCIECNACYDDLQGPFCLIQNEHLEPTSIGKDIPCPTFKSKNALAKCVDCVHLEKVSPRPICHAHGTGKEVTVDYIEVPMPCASYKPKGLAVSPEKPPLGVMREDLWIEERIWELIRGLHERRQYLLKTDYKTDPHLLDKWLDELQRLLPLLRTQKL